MTRINVSPRSRPQVEDEILEQFARRRIQCGKGLVHQEQIGFERQRAGDRRALTLPAGELSRVAFGQFRQPEPLKPGLQARPGLSHAFIHGGVTAVRPIEPPHLQAEGGVVEDRPPGQQAEILQDQARARAGA